jgi:hypothetical protein
MQGTLIGGGCQNAFEPPAKTAQYVLANLDQQPPEMLKSSTELVRVGRDYWRVSPLFFPYEVTESSIVTLLLVGQTKKCDCLWTAELSWSNGETKGNKRIDLLGKPFRTTAEISKPYDMYVNGRWTTFE